MKKVKLLPLLCLLIVGLSSYTRTDTLKSRSAKMKQFSLLVRVPLTYGSEQAQAVNPLWDKLIAEWKSKGAYVISFAFPGESYTVSGAEKAVKKEAVLSGNLKAVSNIVLQADKVETALDLAKQCPILRYGGTVEVREIPKSILVDK
ncbi:hypothetical protein IC235_06640 [Hymenobacter sp. BT664]|uniref:YCII-related domain-containing protein n=1 Tax=Hymenobacter montanus TaxID=2771359 RepID=A0A927BBT9_9BACT|nr:hypothetical protein [Hymenobacter montanus]MBD2767566.1 hypothetical protein [Hymenobacter montanus]